MFMCMCMHVYMQIVEASGQGSSVTVYLIVQQSFIRLFCLLCMNSLPISISVPLVPTGIRVGVVTGGIDGCELPCGCWESNLGPLL